MNIQQFQYILAVAEYKHFELAAEKCYITQSTLSTMISKFEDEIEIQIFDRKKKPVQITIEGQMVIEQIKDVTNQIDRLYELTKEIKGEIKGTLSLSVIPTIAPFLLPMFLQDFAAKFSNLNIKVKEETTSDILRKLKSRELDIGILSIPIQDKDILEIKLYDEPFVHFNANEISTKKMNVKNIKMNHLCLMEEGHCMRTQVMQLCKLNNLDSEPEFNFEYMAGSIDSLLRFVKANKASTLLPSLSVSDFSEKDKKHLRQFASPIPYRTIGIAVHRHFVKKRLLKILEKEIMNKILTRVQTIDIKGEKLMPI